MTPSKKKKKTKKFNRPERASLQNRARGSSKDKTSSRRILKANLRWHRKPGNGSKVNWLGPCAEKRSWISDQSKRKYNDLLGLLEKNACKTFYI